MPLTQLLKAEHIRQRANYFYLVVFGFPLLQCLLQFGILYFNGPKMLTDQQNAWPTLQQGIWGFWSVLTWPLLVGVLGRMVVGIDHDHHNWKNFFSIGISRQAYLWSKLIVYLSGLFIALFVLSLGMVATGLLLSIVQPALYLPGIPGWQELVLMPLAVFAGSFLIAGIHFYLGVRIKPAAIVFGLVVFCTLANLLFAYNKGLAPFYPWSYPALATTLVTGRSDLGTFAWWLAPINFTGMLLLCLAAFRALRRL